LLDFAEGKKTYMVGALMIIMPVADEPTKAILEGLALFGLRKAIK